MPLQRYMRVSHGWYADLVHTSSTDTLLHSSRQLQYEVGRGSDNYAGHHTWWILMALMYHELPTKVFT